MSDTTAPAIDTDTPNREAARYRTQLRAVEAERDALSERVTALRTREVLRLASASLSEPSDLLTIGSVALDSLLDDDGNDIDTEKVTTAVAALIASRPGLAVPSHVTDFDGGARQSPPGPMRTFGDVLRGPR